MRIAIVAVLLASCGPKKWHATADQMAPLPPLVPLATTIGPLAIDDAPPSTSWTDEGNKRKLTENHYLDVLRLRAEGAAFRTVIDTFFQPLTQETKIGFDSVHQHIDLLERLAPYSMWNVTLAYVQSSERLHLCIHFAGLMGSCDRERAKVPRRTPTSAYDIKWATTGVGLVVVHSLTTEATAPQWKSFAGDLRKLDGARGLILDLRDAAGSDPRPLLAWVGKLTNRATIKPLRAIERPAAADPYVAAYAAKFTDRGRDAELWRTLVGGSSPATKPPALPITILVGRYCQSACELVARTLATYANATVIGGVTRAGRVARDEPALLYLPHSQSTVYFHATRYLFDAEIEAATGPTEEWTALVAGDGYDDFAVPASTPKDYVDRYVFAVRDTEYRIEHPAGRPRCDALPTTKQIQTASYLTTHSQMCSGGTSVIITAAAPASALRRFLATCATPIDISSAFANRFYLRGHNLTAAVLSQIASSELVKDVYVDCQQLMHIN